MVRNPIDIWFDFVDPASVLLLLEIEAAIEEGAGWACEAEIRWHPLELRPPPTPLVGIDHVEIAPRWEAARPLASAAGIDFAPPTLVPWSRKAHELGVHADAQGPSVGGRVRIAIARAYALDGQDIGRVDVLVEIAVEHGLDRTETKAVLDVDRYEADVATSRRRAEEGEVTITPTLVAGDRRVEGFHNRTALGTLLGI